MARGNRRSELSVAFERPLSYWPVGHPPCLECMGCIMRLNLRFRVQHGVRRPLPSFCGPDVAEGRLLPLHNRALRLVRQRFLPSSDRSMIFPACTCAMSVSVSGSIADFRRKLHSREAGHNDRPRRIRCYVCYEGDVVRSIVQRRRIDEKRGALTRIVL